MSRPARILFTIPNFTTAGSGQAMVHIIDRLDRSLFEPTVAVLKPGGALTDHLRSSGVDVMVAPFTVAARPIQSLPFRLQAAARHFQGRFDLWHSFHYADDYTEPLIARRAGARAWIYTKKNMSWGSRAWWLRSMLASRIAVQNLQMFDDFFASPLLRSRCRYVPRGIDLQSWQQPRDHHLRDELGIGENSLVVTCVGHVQPRKNQLALVEAIADLPSVHLVLAGRSLDDTYSNEIDERISDLAMAPRVHRLGDVSDVASVLAASDVVALVSHAEGSPVAMLEGMAAGLPGIYSNIGGIRELVDGKNGLLVDPLDVSAIRAALRQLIADPARRKTMAAAAVETVERRATLDIEVARHQSLYLEVLRTHHSMPRACPQ